MQNRRREGEGKAVFDVQDRHVAWGCSAFNPAGETGIKQILSIEQTGRCGL
jgi:hypothetical protein